MLTCEIVVIKKKAKYQIKLKIMFSEFFTY